MVDTLKIRSGTRMQLACDVPVGAEPTFNLTCTFIRSLDESAFLISIPVQNGKAMEMDESRKLLIRYGTEKNMIILAGYADDVVREGIHRYWKIRRVTEQRQFLQRADERVKVTLRMGYKQDTWPTNSDGEIVPEEAISLDISAGGIAMYLGRRFEVGEVCQVFLPDIGTGAAGRAPADIVAVICWEREAPKGSPFRLICGMQFRFESAEEREQLKKYVANIKKKYAL